MAAADEPASDRLPEPDADPRSALGPQALRHATTTASPTRRSNMWERCGMAITATSSSAPVGPRRGSRRERVAAKAVLRPGHGHAAGGDDAHRQIDAHAPLLGPVHILQIQRQRRLIDDQGLPIGRNPRYAHRPQAV